MEQTQKFVEDYQKKGVILQNVKLENFEIANNAQVPAFFVDDTIQAGRQIIQVPKNLIINTKKAFFDQELKNIFQQNSDFFSLEGQVFEHLVILLYLLKEESKQEKSEIFSWLKVQQANKNHLLYWEEQDIKNLKNQKIEKIIAFQKKYLENITNKILQIVQKNDNLFDKDIVNRDMIKKMFVLIITRAINLPKYSGIVPVADLLNHENNQCVFVTEKEIENLLNELETLQKEKNGKKEKKEKYLVQFNYKQIDSDEEDVEEEQEDFENSENFLSFTENQRQQQEYLKKAVEEFYEQGKNFEAMSEIKQIIKKIVIYCNLVLMSQKKKNNYNLNKVIFIIKLQINLTNKIQQMMDLTHEVQEQASYMFLKDLEKLYEKVQQRIPFEVKEQDLNEEVEKLALNYNNNLNQIENKNVYLHENYVKMLEKLEVTKKKFCAKFQQNKDLDINAENWDDEDFEYLNVFSQNEIEQGKQVYASYSLQSNTNLLVNYGFFLKNNEYSSFRFPLKIESQWFQFVKPNMHCNLLEEGNIKIRKVNYYKLRKVQFNCKILEVLRTYNSDIFSTDKIDNFGVISDLKTEMRIIDDLGTMYQKFLIDNDYTETDEQFEERVGKLGIREQNIQRYNREKLDIVVQQIKYLQEILSLVLLLRDNEAKQKEIIESYIPQQAIREYYQALKNFVLRPIMSQEQEEQSHAISL